jgi:choline dehydrogenase-like flavoprotein
MVTGISTGSWATGKPKARLTFDAVGPSTHHREGRTASIERLDTHGIKGERHAAVRDGLAISVQAENRQLRFEKRRGGEVAYCTTPPILILAAAALAQ